MTLTCASNVRVFFLPSPHEIRCTLTVLFTVVNLRLRRPLVWHGNIHLLRMGICHIDFRYWHPHGTHIG